MIVLTTTLTIEPGVEIEFDGPYSIEVIDGGKIISKNAERLYNYLWYCLGRYRYQTPGSEIHYTKIIEEGTSNAITC